MPTVELHKRFDDLNSRFNTRNVMLANEKRRRDNIGALVSTNNKDIEDYKKAIELCIACLDQQIDAKKHIEDITTAMLNAVMQGVHKELELYGEPPEYQFVLEPVENKDGVVNGLKPMIIKNGNADEPRNYGGGVQNLASFAIRLVYLLLNPSLSQVLVLDEPMTNLSPKAWSYVVRFMEDLQRDLDLQVIAITHSGAEFPTTFVVTKEGDTSIVKQAKCV